MNEETETGEVLDWSDAKRAEIVRIAREEIGPQTKGHPRVFDYVQRVMPDLKESQQRYAAKNSEWCGIFALWCLHEAGITEVPWEIGIGFVYRLPRTHDPKPGDIFVIPQPFWHHGVVESCAEKDGRKWLTSVEGNTPSVVRRDRPAPSTAQYYSIDPWLRAKLAL